MYDSLRVRQKPFFLSLATNYDKFTLSIKLHYILMRFVISAGHVFPAAAPAPIYTTFLELSV